MDTQEYMTYQICYCGCSNYISPNFSYQPCFTFSTGILFFPFIFGAMLTYFASQVILCYFDSCSMPKDEAQLYAASEL